MSTLLQEAPPAANQPTGFSLTEEQLAVKRMVREFAESEIAPRVMEWDESQTFPREVIARLGELGMLGVIIPEAYGGAGLSYVDYVNVVEELSRVDGSVGISVAAHNSLCTNHVFLFGSEAQRKRWVVPLAEGKLIGAWGLTEAGAGSDAKGTRTTAVLDGGSWVLNGSKNFITHGSVGDVAVILAVTDRTAGTHGISAFVVDLHQDGIRAGKKENKLGLRASDTATLLMEDCRIPRENLIGHPGEGFSQAMKVLDGGRISIAALALGMAQGAFDASLKYSKQREQFGQPISEFQSIQNHLADMATGIEAARLLTLRAAWLKDRGEKTTKESAMAKLFAGETAVAVANLAVQIHGGYGFTKDFPVEKFYRDVKLCTIGEGTSEIQRMVIARQLLKG
ncbi:MAG TPA: acyl-CoA dehydrogenase [Thermoanaerobaculia bacterium]|nr:acyl-CoA dehydrogenase [Thermoanaerobaculia bacterium]HQR68069.1 acyl-CoA dehydrogenase [Thermoanaerobaculia bacterium]